MGASHSGQFRSSFRGTCFSHLNRVTGSAPRGGAAGSQRIPPGSAKEVSISSRGRIDTRCIEIPLARQRALKSHGPVDGQGGEGWRRRWESVAFDLIR